MIEEFDWSELHLAEPFWLILLLMIPFLAWLHSKGKVRKPSIQYPSLAKIRQTKSFGPKHFHRLPRILRSFSIIFVVLALSRPQLDQSKLDEYTLSIMPMLSAKLVQGDNELLSFIADEFEKNGYQIVGASEILPNLILKPGCVCGTPHEFIARDLKKADKILKLLSPEDIGQGVVIENGLVLGIETLQGTNELLRFVAKTSCHLRKDNVGGIFVKRPKANQNLRFDMPAIGPETIKLALEAGLRGLVVSPHSVIILDKEECTQIAKANNFFILAEEPTN